MNKRHLHLLGVPCVERDNGDVPRFRSQRTIALLGYLVAERRPLTRVSLAALFWPDEPANKGKANLRRELHNLAQILPDCWETSRVQACFAPSSETIVDLDALQQYEAAGEWQAAAGLIHGEFLEGIYLEDSPEFETWLLGERERWRQRAESVLTEVIDADIRQADYAAALDCARRLLQLTPWHEATHRQVMRLLAWTDQRAAALRQYQLCVETLDNELGVPPEPETTRLFDEICKGNMPPSPSVVPSITKAPAYQRHNLPTQTTPFIGRDQELVEITRLLNEPTIRLITIFGPGGMGKTRLALAAAQQFVETNQDRVGFVDLAPLAVGDDIIPAIAEAVGYPFQQDERSPKRQLLDYLRAKQFLLLLDNFEHLLGQVDLVHEILQAGPQINVLVTSRERLQLSGETVFGLEGMELPARELSNNGLNYGAVQLFVQSAQRLRPDFRLKDDNLPSVIRICYLVHGMPLGILLAAAWIDLLSPQEIADEIEKSLDFLATDLHDVPDRQRSIQALFEHSWRRLTESERTAFMKLSVFRGGFTREAAQDVAGASLKLLSALVNKALLQPQRNGRYTLHELLRQYALAKVETASHYEELCTVHSTYYINFLQWREADIKGCRQLAALSEIDADFDNVRAAWQWAIHQQNYDAIGRALESLYWFCEMMSRYQQGWTMLYLACETLTSITDQRAHAVCGQLMGRVFERDMIYFLSPDEAIAQVYASLAIAQAEDNQFEIAFCKWQLGRITLHNDFKAALAYYKDSFTYYQSVDDRFYMALLLRAIGQLDALRGYRDLKRIHQSLNIRRDIGDRVGMIRSLNVLASVLFFDGHFTESESYCRETYQVAAELYDRFNMALNLVLLAGMTSTVSGDLENALDLLQRATPLVRELDNLRLNYEWLEQMGCLLGYTEEYNQCRQFCQQAALISQYRFVDWAHFGLCLAACGLDEIQIARQELRVAIEFALRFHAVPHQTQCVALSAVILAREDKPILAVELLSLAIQHPRSPQGWLGKWPPIKRLRTELEAHLTNREFANAWEHGCTRDLETTVEILLTEL